MVCIGCSGVRCSPSGAHGPPSVHPPFPSERASRQRAGEGGYSSATSGLAEALRGVARAEGGPFHAGGDGQASRMGPQRMVGRISETLLRLRVGDGTRLRDGQRSPDQLPLAARIAGWALGASPDVAYAGATGGPPAGAEVSGRGHGSSSTQLEVVASGHDLVDGLLGVIAAQRVLVAYQGEFCASARAPARQHDLDLPRPDQCGATGTEKAVRQSRRAVCDQLLAESLAGSPGVRTDMEWLFSNLQNQVRRHLEGAVDPDWLNPAQQSQDRRSHHAVPAVGRECAKVDVERKVAVAAHPRALRARVGCHQRMGKVEATDPKSGPQTSSPAGTGPA
mmetsp:Transcript_160313/g.510241  ORF Transcript_160313/g.510241 Transcript_160313/m.510241 type:complete len:336 (+) Transcript_160313:219-1226(+)